MSLRVLLDLSALQAPSVPRGVKRYASLLARALHRARTEQDLELLALLDAPLFGLPRYSSDVLAAIELLETTAVPSSRAPLTARLGSLLGRTGRKNQVDVMHSLYPGGSTRRVLDSARVVTCHHLDGGIAATEWHGTQARVGLGRRHFQRAERIIAISRATAQELIVRLNLPRNRITVVHNGIDRSLWTPAARHEDPSRLAALGLRGQPYFLCVGAVDARKNVDGVLRALARAQALATHKQLLLVWVGALGRSERSELVSLAKQQGVEGSVLPIDHASDEDLAALYRNAMALVFASRREGFGYPVVEAMASGCPVITSNRSSMAEIAEHAALTVDPDDSSAIADAMVLLYGDQHERRRLRDAGLLRATQFDLDDMVRGTVAVYRAALLATRGTPNPGSLRPVG